MSHFYFYKIGDLEMHIESNHEEEISLFLDVNTTFDSISQYQFPLLHLPLVFNTPVLKSKHFKTLESYETPNSLL